LNSLTIVVIAIRPSPTIIKPSQTFKQFKTANDKHTVMKNTA